MCLNVNIISYIYTSQKSDISRHTRVIRVTIQP